MLTDLLPVLRCPWCAAGPLTAEVSAAGDDGRRILQGVLRCPGCAATSTIEDGIWDAMGPHRVHRTLAQLSNVVPPTPQLYERAWRRRSLTLLSRRPFPVDEELAELLVATAPHPGSVAVDVACSEGLYARALADAGATVIAVDHSLPFLRRVVAREDARRSDGASGASGASGAIVAVRALAQHLPLADGAADIVAMGGSLNEIGDARAALAEMARVGHPGAGRIFSMHLVRATRPLGRLAQLLAGPSGIAFRDADQTVQLFESAGLAVGDVRRDGVVQRIAATVRAAG